MVAMFFLNLLRKNKFYTKRSLFYIAKCTERRLKKVTIKISGENNTLRIGKNCRIQNCEIRLKGRNNTILIGDHVVFKSGKIYLAGGEGQEITIGNGTTVEGAYLLSDENASITIGEDCMLATDILIRTGDKHSIVELETGKRVNYSESIMLGKHVWLGRSVQLLKGASLPDNTIVGAGSLVNKKFTDNYTVVAGVPSKVVKHNVNWLRELI